MKSVSIAWVLGGRPPRPTNAVARVDEQSGSSEFSPARVGLPGLPCRAGHPDRDCRAAQGCLGRRRLFRQARRFDGVFIHKKKFNLLDAFVLRRQSRKIIYSFDDAVMLDRETPESSSRAHLCRFAGRCDWRTW